METVLAFLEKIGNYLVLVRFTDILDVVIIAFLVYKLLDLVKSTRAENILKGVVMFLLGYFLTAGLPTEGWRYAAAIIAAAVFFLPSVFYDRRAKREESLTYTILRLF